MKYLNTEIDRYLSVDPVRFHIPSHKGRSKWAAFREIAKYDITELPFSDNLNDPRDVLLHEENRASDIFGVKQTIFTVNGASAAVMSAIITAVGETDSILIPSNSHVSCYYGAIHAGANVVRCTVNDPIIGVTLHEIQACAAAHPKLKACVITNPTYFGCVNDIESICNYLKSMDIAVIVDESHGTHFHFSEAYPISATDTGADMIVHSGHKTINGMTQTGMLHLNSNRFSADDLRNNMHLLQTTSPSYPLILSLVYALDELKNSTDILNSLQLWYNKFEQMLTMGTSWYFINRKKTSDCLAYGYDPLKLCLSCAPVNGHALNRLLMERFHIYAEMSSIDMVLFCAGLSSEEKDYMRLNNALLQLYQEKIKIGTCDFGTDFFENFPLPTSVMNIRTAYRSASEFIAVQNLRNRISADFVFVYPPGAPLLIPGDLITDEIADYLQNSQAELIGLHENKLKVVNV